MSTEKKHMTNIYIIVFSYLRVASNISVSSWVMCVLMFVLQVVLSLYYPAPDKAGHKRFIYHVSVHRIVYFAVKIPLQALPIVWYFVRLISNRILDPNVLSYSSMNVCLMHMKGTGLTEVSLVLFRMVFITPHCVTFLSIFVWFLCEKICTCICYMECV